MEESGLKYWGKVQGHRLYYFDSIEYMYAWRLAAIHLAFDQLGLGIQADAFNVWLDSLKKAFNDQDLTGVGSLINFMDGYKNRFGQYDLLMHVAGCGVLVDGEPTGQFSEKHNKIKERLLRENEELRAFFLNTAASYLLKLNPESPISEIRAYWESLQGKRMASTLWQVTQMPRFAGLWKNGTRKASGWQSSLVSVCRMIFLASPSQSTTNT